MIACGHCRAANLPNTLFCDQCGGGLSATATRGDRAQRRVIVCHLRATGQQFVLPLGPVLVFGRADHAAHVRPDIDLGPYGAAGAGVSRRHAQLLQRHNALYLEDLQSLNGTYINGVRVPPHQPTRLQPNALIRFGQLELRFEPADQPA